MNEYQNKKLGFSLIYPDTWIVEESENRIQFTSQKKKRGDSFVESVTMNITNVDASIDVSKFLEEEMSGETDATYFTLNNYPATKSFITTDKIPELKNVEVHQILLIKDSILYRLNIVTNDKITREKILNSFMVF